jgi:hypothetical protein
LNKDVSAIKPVAHLKADELIFELKKNENFFKDEVLSVQGFLFETNTKNGNFNILIKGDSNQNQYIICEMNKSFDKLGTGLEKKESVVVKGVLKGYLNDAILLNCVLENSLKNE